jgi:epoxide hydrolase-like predicted phosphatase
VTDVRASGEAAGEAVRTQAAGESAVKQPAKQSERQAPVRATRAALDRVTQPTPNQAASSAPNRAASAPGRTASSATPLRAVITDWGGVLTQPIKDTVRDWIDADQIDWDTYLAVITPWLSSAYSAPITPAAPAPGTPITPGTPAEFNPVHALERGECTVAEFERLLAARLVRTDGKTVIAEGLLTRMLSAGRPVPAMYELIRTLRRQGLRTALLSNSWGPAGYPREDFPELFDAVVISGEVGMRKPEPQIFRHAAQELGLPPEVCVFIDDVEANVSAAISCGMTGVHHTDPAATVARLTELFANR